MKIIDFIPQDSVWIEAESSLATAADQISLSESEAAPVFFDGRFSGLFVPCLHWKHIFRDIEL